MKSQFVSDWKMIALETFALTLIVGLTANAAALTPIVVNLASRDLVYSPLNDTVYATVPNSSPTNPNSLMPINPSTGTLGAAIPIGFDPRDVVISSDGTTIHTVFGGNRGVQPFNVPGQSLGSPFVIPGGPQVKEMHSIPGRPNAVLIATHDPGFSPPATGTQVWENGVELPDHVGQGLGTGGPDIVAVDPTNGSRGYGYQNTVSGYTHWSMTIDANGVHTDAGPTLQNVMNGFNIGRIELLGNRLFNSRGEVYSISPAFQSGAFLGGENFVIDVPRNRLFSITSSGSSHTIRSYLLSTLQLQGSDTVSGIAGTTSSLTRFGTNGLAFRTSNNQIVFVRSALVPEPAGFALAAAGFFGGLTVARRRIPPFLPPSSAPLRTGRKMRRGDAGDRLAGRQKSYRVI
jgi:hypothetical protein